MYVKRQISFEKQQPIDLSNTRGVFRGAAVAPLKTPVVLLTSIVCCFSKDTRRVAHIYCLLLL
jgi:hypothetical protein